MEISIKWNVCRICLQEEQKSSLDSLRPLFEDKDLARQVYDVTGVVIRANDSLPDKVCARCFSSIKNAISLRLSCRKSDKYLKSVLHRTQSATSLFRLKRKHEDVCSSHEDVIEETCEWHIKDTEATSSKKHHEAHNNSKQNSEVDLDLDLDETNDVSLKKKLKIVKVKNEDDKPAQLSSKVSNNKPKITIPTSTKLNQSLHNFDEHESVLVERTQSRVDNEEEELEDNYDKNSSDLNPISSECSIETISIINDDRTTTTSASKKLQLKVTTSDMSATIGTEANNDNDAEDSQDILSPNECSDDRPPADIYFVLNEEDIKKEYIQHKSDNDEDMESTNTLELINIDEAEFIDDEDVDIDSRSNATFNDLEHIEYIVDELPEQDDGGNENDLIELSKSHDTDMSSICSSSILTPSSQTRRSFACALSAPNNYHVCEVCGNSFTNRSLLNYHMRTHRQPKNFECELCFKRFNAACNLTAHMRTHTGEKPFECQYCHRRFTDRSTHIKHERIHTNEKPFNCNVCGKSFSLSTTLKAHEKVHSGEKPYKCEPCGKSFKLPHQLKAHLNTHQHKILAVEH